MYSLFYEKRLTQTLLSPDFAGSYTPCQKLLTQMLLSYDFPGADKTYSIKTF